jgi:hypothetical protein
MNDCGVLIFEHRARPRNLLRPLFPECYTFVCFLPANAPRQRSRSLTPLAFGCAGFGIVSRGGEAL